jgi:hypothetical protein
VKVGTSNPDRTISLKGCSTYLVIIIIIIIILYMYMFRAISCSSSGCQIVLTQHLVLSLSVSDRPVHRCALRVTITDAVLIQFDLLRMSKISLGTCTYRGL